MLDPSKFSEIQWSLFPILIFGRYVVMAGILYLIFYVWRRRALLFRKIQERFPQNKDYWREIGHSAVTSLIFAVVAWLFLGTPLREYTQFYSDIQHNYNHFTTMSKKIILAALLSTACFGVYAQVNWATESCERSGFCSV